MDCSLLGSSVHGILQARSGVGCHALLQRLFPTQGSNPHLFCIGRQFFLSLASPGKCVNWIHKQMWDTSICQLSRSAPYELLKNYLSFLCCLIAQLCLTLGDPMDCSTPGFSVPHYLPEFAQTHVHLELISCRLSGGMWHQYHRLHGRAVWLSESLVSGTTLSL